MISLVVAESDIPSGSVTPAEPAFTLDVGMRTPLVTEVVIFNFGSLPRQNATRPHLHTFHQIDVVLSGLVNHWAEGVAARNLQAGDAMVIAPLSRHECQSAQGYSHASFKLFLAPHVAKRLGWSMTFRPTAALMAMINEVGGSLLRREDHAVDCISACASLLIAEAMRHLPTQPPVSAPLDDFRRLVLPVLQAVDENPGTQWSVEMMADRCNLSTDHFTRCFHRAFRQPPMQYLLTSRMRRAAGQLLAFPPLAIKEVAHRLGYSSVQTFSRAFRAAVGISPARFRANPHGAHVSPYL